MWLIEGRGLSWSSWPPQAWYHHQRLPKPLSSIPWVFFFDPSNLGLSDPSFPRVTSPCDLGNRLWALSLWVMPTVCWCLVSLSLLLLAAGNTQFKRCVSLRPHLYCTKITVSRWQKTVAEHLKLLRFCVSMESVSMDSRTLTASTQKFATRLWLQLLSSASWGIWCPWKRTQPDALAGKIDSSQGDGCFPYTN